MNSEDVHVTASWFFLGGGEAVVGVDHLFALEGVRIGCCVLARFVYSTDLRYGIFGCKPRGT